MLKTKSNLFIITSFILVAVLMISNAFIYQDISVKNTNNSFPSHLVFAQDNTTTTNSPLFNSSISSKTTTNENSQSNTEQTISRQGLVTSSQARNNETSHIAVILPHRDDGKSYTGVLTFSASQPVSLAFLQRLSLDNNTLSKIDFKKYGEMSPKWIRDIPSQHNLNHTGLQIIAGISPNYGSSTPYYSMSIPFVADGVALWSQSGTPFLASYQVFAKLIQPEIVNNINDNEIK